MISTCKTTTLIFKLNQPTSLWSQGQHGLANSMQTAVNSLDTNLYSTSGSSVGDDCQVCLQRAQGVPTVSLYETLPLPYKQWRHSASPSCREWQQWAVDWSSCCCAGGHQVSLWTVGRHAAQYPPPVRLAAAQVSVKDKHFHGLILASYPVHLGTRLTLSLPCVELEWYMYTYADWCIFFKWP